MTGYRRDASSAGQPTDLADRSWIELIDEGLLDPRLLEHPPNLSGVVVRELARTVYPGWSDFPPDQEDEIEAFNSVVTPLLLTRRPLRAREVEPLVQLALELVEAA